MSHVYFLKHSYSSQYYDPEYAKWYYENYTKLGKTKGRRKSPSLNEYGKAAAQTVKEKITAEKKQKLEELSAQKKDVRQRLSEQKSSEIKKEREKLKSDLKNHKEQTKNKIQQLWNRLKTMSSSERASQTGTIRAEIERLKEENASQKEKLAAAYKQTSTDIRENYKELGKQVNESFKEQSKQIVEQYNNLYLSELDKMGSDSAFTGRSSTNSTSGASSANSSAPKQEKKQPKKHGVGYKMYNMGRH